MHDRNIRNTLMADARHAIRDQQVCLVTP